MSSNWEFTCKPDRMLQRALREAVRDQLALWNLARDVVNRVLLVVDEIVGNSIDHGYRYRRASGRLEVRLTLVARDLRVVVVDPDTPEPIVRDLGRRLASATKPPPLDAERGRGLYLIGNTLEDVLFDWKPDQGMMVSGFVRGVT